jgi:hypothetical protein
MRLITSLKRLEVDAARARKKREPAAVGLSWSKHEVAIDADSLQPGEYIAVDIRIEGCAREQLDAAKESGRLPAATSAPPCWWAVTERVTRDVQDLGVVRDYFGNRLGRVVELEGSMVTIEMDEAAEPVAGLAAFLLAPQARA